MKTSALITAILVVATGACTTEVTAPPRHDSAPDGPIHAPSSPRAPVDAGSPSVEPESPADAGQVDVTPEPIAHDAPTLTGVHVVALDPRVLSSAHFHLHPRESASLSSAHFHVHAH